MAQAAESSFQEIALYSLPLRVDLKSPHSETNFANLNRSYTLWREVWQATLSELDGTSDLASDHFSRQDYCNLIEIDGEPAGLCCFRFVDLRHSWAADDSWFAPWPKEILLRYTKTHRHALVPSWLTVAPAFRKTAGYRGPSLAATISYIFALGGEREPTRTPPLSNLVGINPGVPYLFDFCVV